MKVYVANYISAIQRYGGISRFVNKLIYDLRAADSSGAYYFEEVRNRTTINKKDTKSYNKLERLSFLIYRIFRLFILKPDLVHDTYPTRFSWVFKRKKTLISVYDCMPEIFANQFSEKIRLQRKEIITSAFHIHAISKSTKQDIIRIFGIPENKITVIYLNHMKDKKSQFLGEKFEYRKKVLFVGSRSGYKNFFSAGKIFKLMLAMDADLIFSIFGGGDLQIEEKAMLAELGVPETSYEQINGDDDVLDQQYKQARVLLYTSLYEGFGLPVLESLSCDCPVIVTDSSSLKEVMPQRKYRLLNYEENEINKVLPYFLNETMWNETLIQQKNTTSFFTKHDPATELVKLYERLANK